LSEAPIKIMVVDDTEVNVRIIQKFLEPKGYELICAYNGRESIDKFRQNRPDIILMDVMMPDMTGYEATTEIKKLMGSTWVPILFLSAKTEIEDQIQGLEVGGDDYLTKPVDLNMLRSKLRAVMRIVEMQRKLDDANKKISAFADQYREEMRLAKELVERMSSLVNFDKKGKNKLFLEAVDEISGDIVFNYQCEHSDKQYYMLADATGHGLTAAISLLPLSQAFNLAASQCLPLVDMLNMLNDQLHTMLPADRFVAASLAVVDEAKKTIEIWNGSNPAPRIIDKTDGKIITNSESHFCLGVVDSKTFSPKISVYNYVNPCEVVFFSDGVIDAKNANDEAFGTKGIDKSLANYKTNSSFFKQLLENLNKFREDARKVDDICILSISCT